VRTKLARDARVICTDWLREMNLARLVDDQLAAAQVVDLDVDLVAVGKASREMMAAASQSLGSGVIRRLTICDAASAALESPAPDVMVGEHPVPGEGSLAAGRALVAFLDEGSKANATVFLLSGGASSLCVLPAPPVTLDDLRAVFDAALLSGADITTLNKIRASVSLIGGGAVLGHARTERSLGLIMVDNVVSGAEWVASGLTYGYDPSRDDVASLLAEIGLAEGPLGARLLEGLAQRALLLEGLATKPHQNVVVAEPSMVHELAVAEARRRGYRVLDMGSRVHGDVRDAVEEWTGIIKDEVAQGDPIALVGVGEVTVKVRGTGKGGRCQEFAWRMLGALAELERDSAFVARASDGRDYVDGVAGAWVDKVTFERAQALGIDWAEVVAANDSYSALSELHQLIEGRHTGWNLCDIYVATL